MKATKIGNKKRNGSMIAVILITSFLSVNAIGIGFNPDMQFHALETGSDNHSTEKLASDISELLLDENAVILEEDEIKSEKWMMNINDNIWAQDAEEEMPIEKWMTNLNDEVWSNTDTEEDMKVEDWMANPSDWLN